jgi:uncharacterized protein (DUF885 family)
MNMIQITSTQNNAQVQLQELLKEEWETRLQNDPLLATYCGDHRFDSRLPEMTESAMKNWAARLRGFLQRLEGIPRQQLQGQELLNYDIFRRLLNDEVADIDLGGYRMPLSKAGGYHTYLPESLPTIMRFENAADYETYLERMQAFPRYSDQHLELLRQGLLHGFIPSKVTLEGVAEQARAQITDPLEASLWFEPFLRMPDSLDAPECQRLQQAGKDALEHEVFPAYARLVQFLEQEYEPAAVEAVGAWRLPNGLEFYRQRVRSFTSLEVSPEQVHQTGLDEVRRIRQEMQAVSEQAGFTDIASFIEYMRREPRFYARTKEELLKETALILKRMDGELPRLFKTLPRTPYGIREVPAASAPGSTTAYYFPPAGDGKTAGFYYVNTYALESRPFYELEALSLHEAVPGHHLQIALQMELELPEFRRFNGFTAFVEGWALYSERLGLETGFYQDPFNNFGRLSYEMWRACRLVVDTGMHALNWTRQQAIDFMLENTSLSPLNISNEVDRYIAWPGQALAYKIGELKIRELRALAEKELGPRFNLREFHDVVLTSGAVPLDVLEEMVRRWINE